VLFPFPFPYQYLTGLEAHSLHIVGFVRLFAYCSGVD
jgi:hypothetical protein